MKTTNSKPPIERIYPIVLTVFGLVGLVAMTWQSSERIHMLKNPDAELSCSLNPVVDCGGVLGNHLSALFGFPNAFLGMIFFAILSACGLLLLSGGTFTRWFRSFVMSVSTILMLFSAWFFAVSLYVLGKICIFCVFGWVASVPIFWYGLLHFLRSSDKKRSKRMTALVEFGERHHLDIIILAYVIMISLFLFRFRDYYFAG